MRSLAVLPLVALIACNAILGLDEGQPLTGAGGAASSATQTGAGTLALASSTSGGVCGGGASCEPSMTGFAGPVVLLKSGEPCGSESTPSADVILESEVANPSCACACAMSEASCSTTLVIAPTTFCGGQGTTGFKLPTGAGCQAVPGLAGGSVGALAMLQAACVSLFDTTPPPLPKRSVCAVPGGASCGPSSTCVAHPPGARVCVLSEQKDGGCPKEYPSHEVALAAQSVNDTRGCAMSAGCTCNVTQDPDCSGVLQVFSDGACSASLGAVMVSAPGSPSTCDVLSGATLNSASYAPTSLGACTPIGGSTPTGSVTGTTTSLCCHD